jgi:hypothetical protein
MAMTKEDAQQYVNRYAAISALEALELAKLTPEESYRQVLLLMQAALDYGWAEQARDEDSVRATWLKLKGHGRLA